MKSETITLLQTMDDFRLLRFFNYFSTTLFNKVDEDAEKIVNQLPQEIKKIPAMQTVIHHEKQYSMPLEQKEAVEFARTSLVQLANIDTIEPALAEAIKNYHDDEQPAGVILALGGVVSFILLISTSKIEYATDKGWKIQIGGNPIPKGISEIIIRVKELFSVIPNSILKLTSKE